ncbi:hypothetical protein FNV43_RR14287 [Rhamnella rubrinervis]|uniref:Cytochrome P450 n=1 Tax=Rhamnella rubrinervis TaxID=2594499 RepID=A0A8K0H2Q0_9ROSA|nr:hypothetical protein FNV43_RR14287 [Rhamnella rubrinervis]
MSKLSIENFGGKKENYLPIHEEFEHGLETAGRNSYKFLRDTAFNFIVAGRGECRSCLVFMVCCDSPIEETKILQEMRDEYDDRDDGLVFDAQQVRKLVYQQTALCETLRLYPPVPRNHKAPSQPYTPTSCHLLNRNQTVCFHIMKWLGWRIYGVKVAWNSSQRDGLINIDSDGVRSIVHVAAYKFPAFNAGPRTC